MSQVLVLDRDKTLGANAKDQMMAMYELADYNVLMGGTTQSSISGELTDANNGGSDYWIILFDSGSFKPIWNKTYGGSKDEVLSKVKLLSDGSYLLAGSSKSDMSGDKSQKSKGGWDYWLVKINSSGDKLWDKTLGGSGDDILSGIDESWDGGYLLGGYSVSDKSGDKTEDSQGGTDYWVIKIDANGNFQWDKTYGGSAEDSLKAIVSYPAEKKYLLAGCSTSPADSDKTVANTGNIDFWALQLDASGKKEWDHTYGGAQTNVLVSAEVGLNDKGYLLVGYSNSNASGSKSQNSKGGYDYWLVSTDSAGKVVWDKTYGGNFDDFASTVLYSIEGRHVIGGYSKSDAVEDKTMPTWGGYDYWLLKVDSFGSKVYDYDYGGFNDDFMYCLSQSCNRGFYVGGESYSNDDGDKTETNRGISDYWLVKLNSPTIPQFSFVVSCEGSVSLFYDRSETFPDYWYWSFDDPTSGADNNSYDRYPSHTFDQPGTYYVTLVVKEGCQDDTTVTIPVTIPENRLRDEISLGNDTILCEGSIMQLAVPYDSSYTYTWSTGATTNAITIDEPNTYTIIATDGICTNYDEVIIGNCPRLFTPNIFSPDGDGNNDYFFVYGLGITELELTIFDRWGQKVFDTTDMNIGWDGTLNGHQLPIDTYVYRIYYKGIGSTEFKKIGSISLVR